MTPFLPDLFCQYRIDLSHVKSSQKNSFFCITLQSAPYFSFFQKTSQKVIYSHFSFFCFHSVRVWTQSNQVLTDTSPWNIFFTWTPGQLNSPNFPHATQSVLNVELSKHSNIESIPGLQPSYINLQPWSFYLVSWI